VDVKRDYTLLDSRVNAGDGQCGAATATTARSRSRKQEALARLLIGWPGSTNLSELRGDLGADPVLLLVQRPLLLLGDVAVVLAGHGALFTANLTILLVQVGGLSLAQFALLD